MKFKLSYFAILSTSLLLFCGSNLNAQAIKYPNELWAAALDPRIICLRYCLKASALVTQD